MKNIFIVPKGLSTGVIHSQIFEMVLNLNMVNKKENYIIMHESDQEKLEKYDDIYNSLLLYLLREKDIEYIYIRSIFDFMKAYIVKKIFLKSYKILYDFRGIINEESYLRNGSNIRKQILFFIERFVYNKADKIHTVSNNLKNYLENNFGHRKINVIPCVISHNTLKEISNKKSIDFVYLGSISVWQKFEETIELYRRIENKLDNTKLTIITLDQDVAKEIAEKHDISNYQIKSLSHQEVLKELKNYDFGFLLRDNNIVNNTASPIKFLEYVSNGVIPIMSNSIGDYSKITFDNNIGIILNDKFHIDIKSINVLLEDKDIFLRMKDISDNFLWKNILKNFFNE